MVSWQNAVSADFFKVHVGNLSGSSRLTIAIACLPLENSDLSAFHLSFTANLCYFLATMENDISTTAHVPLFLYQSARLATDLLPSVTYGGCRSNAVSYLHMLEASSWTLVYTCHSNNHWIFFFLFQVLQRKSLIS